MKKSCLFFDKKIQMCLFHSPLQRSYLNPGIMIMSQHYKLLSTIYHLPYTVMIMLIISSGYVRTVSTFNGNKVKYACDIWALIKSPVSEKYTNRGY